MWKLNVNIFQKIPLRNRHVLILDMLLLLLTPAIALGLRVDLQTVGQYTKPLLLFTLVSLLIKWLVFYYFGLYRRYWLYANTADLFTIALATGVTTLLCTGFVFGQSLLPSITHLLPRSTSFIDGLLTLVVVGGNRFLVRFVQEEFQTANHRAKMRRVLVIGAGRTGAMCVRELQNADEAAFTPIAFLDDNPAKKGLQVRGLPVLGDIAQLPAIAKTHAIDDVVIAIPDAAGDVIRRIVKLCEVARVPSFILPSFTDLISGRLKVSQLRKVEIQDLLRRKPVQTDISHVHTLVHAHRVLVTGAGGSIGSELCRQLLQSQPAVLYLLGHGENSIFQLVQELKQTCLADKRLQQVAIYPIVADIRDYERLAQAFALAQPELVFHAAAHKHVPLMEMPHNIHDAVSNNVLGTWNLLQLCERTNVERFVLISSDKAVNPANVMGATKRLAEMLVQDVAYRTQRPFVAVRFGNVLGSRGSVVPIFEEQIRRGGPITITHPDMERFFMTIPEAVQLVLQAACFQQAGAIYVLDMGEPVKIVDLARDLIELSGYRVDQDIQIAFTGLRPGEKLSEELFTNTESHRRTQHEKIFQTSSQTNEVDFTMAVAQAFLRDMPEQSQFQLHEQLFRYVQRPSAVLLTAST
jgi:FlaA1/EpsC-like NDP-sugar epimerase